VSPSSLEEALESFVAKPLILLALDFDGTLAPLGDDPTLSRMIPEARSALEALTPLPGVSVGLVTGRAIESVLEVALPLPQWYLVGSHGIEVVTPENRDSYSTPDVVPPELAAAFQEVVDNHRGTRLEFKPFGIALHTRGVPAEIALAAETAAHTLCLEWGNGLVVRTGHGIVECSVRDATKGDGIVALLGEINPSAVLFAGDDVTDEDGFKVLGDEDIAIRVGGGETIASYHLENALAVSDLLWRIYRLRTARDS
jgi:trehalose 6-phosphate phosphatase